jgi:hypothetical protein
MKQFYLRFRILLLTLALGLASVPFFNNECDKWTEIKVDLPKIESDSPIFIFPKQGPIIDPQPVTKGRFIQNRDLSLYNFGGEYSDCRNIMLKEIPKCQIDKAKARKFIWKHWQNKKRAYLVVTFSSVDNSSDAHIFVEPDAKGNWNLIWIWERFGMWARRGYNFDLLEINSVKLKRATKGDYEYLPGEYYLSFLDKDGEEATNY